MNLKRNLQLQILSLVLVMNWLLSSGPTLMKPVCYHTAVGREQVWNDKKYEWAVSLETFSAFFAHNFSSLSEKKIRLCHKRVL